MKPFFIKDDDPPSKQAILKAALKLFSRDGISETNIRAIGNEAGYSNPALFKFFKTKNELAIYLFTSCYDQYATSLQQALLNVSDFPKGVHQIVSTYAHFVEIDPEAFFFVHDNLRLLLPQIQRTKKSVSILYEFTSVINLGCDQGFIKNKKQNKVLMAAWSGFLFQFARMHFFGEFKGPFSKYVSEIEKLSLKILVD